MGFCAARLPLFYEILATRPDLAEGPPGVGQIVGDMHLENVGAFQTDAEDEVVFDLNDFDDTCVGPLRFDVLRLATSVLLAGRTFQATGLEALELVRELLDAHRSALFERSQAPEPPAPVTELVERASRRSRKDLLDARAPAQGGKRLFSRGERYFELEADVLAEVPALVSSYVTALGERVPPHAKNWRVVDAAHRVAGTGSLGRRRIALLLEDKEGTHRLYELKQSGEGSAARLVGKGSLAPSERIVRGARALVERPMRQLAALPPSHLGRFVGRKLCPAEDKLDLAALRPSGKLSAVVRAVGHVLGSAHARAASELPAEAWSDAALGEIVDHAVELAGMLEAVYLAYARLYPA